MFYTRIGTFISVDVHVLLGGKMANKKNRKNKEFDAIYNAIRNPPEKHPQVKPLVGQQKGTATYVEQ